MAKTSLANIKNWFLTGLKPTQAQFWNVFDSFWHKDEKIAQSNVDNLTNSLDAKAEKQAFETHLTDAQAHNNLFNAKVDKIAGKGLSTEDLTSELLALIQSALQRVDVQDLPDSPETELPASANQVRLLNVAVTNILNLLNSDDVTLDELQEVVDFIKANREDLQNLAIPNIAGLVDALAQKVDKEAGKALSTNDFTDAYKAQLDNPPPSEISIQDGDGIEQFSSAEILFDGFQFDPVSKKIKQVGLVPFNAFVDTINGDDQTAELKNPKKPFKTDSALWTAIIADGSENWKIIFLNQDTRVFTSALPNINLSFLDPFSGHTKFSGSGAIKRSGLFKYESLDGTITFDGTNKTMNGCIQIDVYRAILGGTQIEGNHLQATKNRSFVKAQIVDLNVGGVFFGANSDTRYDFLKIGILNVNESSYLSRCDNQEIKTLSVAAGKHINLSNYSNGRTRIKRIEGEGSYSFRGTVDLDGLTTEFPKTLYNPGVIFTGDITNSGLTIEMKDQVQLLNFKGRVLRSRITGQQTLGYIKDSTIYVSTHFVYLNVWATVTNPVMTLENVNVIQDTPGPLTAINDNAGALQLTKIGYINHNGTELGPNVNIINKTPNTL